MLKPNCEAKEFEKYGFKRCKGIAGKSECYYLCVANGCKMLFVSNCLFVLMIGKTMIHEYMKIQIANTEIIEIRWILYMI